MVSRVEKTRSATRPISHGPTSVRRIGSGRVRRCSKSHGSGWVESRDFQNITGQVGSGRVRRFSILAGRVLWSQEVSKSHGSGRVGSGGFQNLAVRAVSGRDISKVPRVRLGHTPRLHYSSSTFHPDVTQRALNTSVASLFLLFFTFSVPHCA